MRQIIALAWKDIRLLFSDRLTAFFVVIFPLLMGLFFGLMLNFGGSGRTTKMKVAVVDLDDTKYSRLLVESLQANKNISVEIESDVAAARQSVQRGTRVAMLVIPSDFGRSAGLFWEQQPAIGLGVDPSRSAEGAMLEGFLMEAVGGLFGKRMSNPKELIGSAEQWTKQIRDSQSLSDTRRQSLLELSDDFSRFIDKLDQIQASDDPSSAASATNDNPDQTAFALQLARVEKLDVTRQVDSSSKEGLIQKLRSRWDISFPQAMLWGVLGCVAGFATSVAQEREIGTLVRLQVAPIGRLQLLSGKALACFLTTLSVMSLLTCVGYYLGMRPNSFAKLLVAAVCVATCFVGIMMTLSTLGKSVQSVSGIGWASNMIMAMIGGCMIPVMFMPDFIAKLSIFSPVRWAIVGLEGAIWRTYTWTELIQVCGVLVSIGVVGLLIGIWNQSRHTL
jgi:ABC-2 type transport system permease protein